MSFFIGNYEWLFTKSRKYVTIISKNDDESIEKLKEFCRVHMNILLPSNSIFWDFKEQVGYVCEY